MFMCYINYLYRFWCTLLKQCVDMDTQNYLNTLWPTHGNVFELLPVCIWWDRGRKNHPICLKFGSNIYTLYEIFCLVFRVHWLIRVCNTKISQCITAYGVKFFEISFNVVSVNKVTQMLSRIVCLENGCALRILRVQGHAK